MVKKYVWEDWFVDRYEDLCYNLYEAWRTGFGRELSVRELNFKLFQGQCFFYSFQYFFFEDPSSSIFNFYSHQARQIMNVLPSMLDDCESKTKSKMKSKQWKQTKQRFFSCWYWLSKSVFFSLFVCFLCGIVCDTVEKKIHVQCPVLLFFVVVKVDDPYPSWIFFVSLFETNGCCTIFLVWHSKISGSDRIAYFFKFFFMFLAVEAVALSLKNFLNAVYADAVDSVIFFCCQFVLCFLDILLAIVYVSLCIIQ